MSSEKPEIFEESLVVIEHAIHETINRIILEDKMEWTMMRRIHQLTINQLTELKETIREKFSTCTRLSDQQVNEVTLAIWQNLENACVGIFAAAPEDELMPHRIADALHKTVQYILWGSTTAASHWKVVFDFGSGW